MTQHDRAEHRDEPAIINGMPEGFLDWELDQLIQAKCAVDGYEDARDFLAQSLNRWNDRISHS
jgi:hypothetical protein